MPSPAYVQSVIVRGSSTGVSSRALTITGVTAGNCLLVQVTGSVAGVGPKVTSVKDDLNNVLSLVNDTESALNFGSLIYVLFNATSGSRTITANFSNSVQYASLIILEYSSVAVVGASNGATAGAGTALDSGAATMFGTNQMLVGFGTLRTGANPTLTAGGGFTSRQADVGASSWSIEAADLLQATQGNIHSTFTGSASGSWTDQIVALAAAPATLTKGVVVLSGTQIGTSGSHGGNGNDLTKLTDANPWTPWDTPDTTGIDWAGVDCGAAIPATLALISAYPGGGTWNQGLFQGTNDVTWANFVNLFRLSSNASTFGTLLNTANFPYAGYFRYYRFLMPNGTYQALSDLEFWGNYYSGVVAQSAPVTISPPGGFYDFPTSVTMSCPTTDAVIYYTIDGSTPTISSTQYTGPIVVGSNQVINAIAVSTSLSNSRVVSASFHIASIVPTDMLFEVGRNGYRLWGYAAKITQDPISGSWYWYGYNVDQPGVLTPYGGQGVNCYSSPDLRNWTWQSQVIPGPSIIGDRSHMIYNASTTKYVIWSRQAYASQMYVYTANSPAGPFTQQASYTALDGLGLNGDFCLFQDNDGTAYLIHSGAFGGSGGSVGALGIHKLTSDYLNTSTVFVSYNNDNTSPFGQMAEGHIMIRIGSVYFWQTSGYSIWAPNKNLYVTNSGGPLAAWSAASNPFQVDPANGATGSGGVSGYSPNLYSPPDQFAFDTQTAGIIFVPGRNGGAGGLIYIGDRWDLTSPSMPSNPNDSFTHWREISLPCILTSSTSYIINWVPNWSFDSAMPQGTNLPAAASSVVVTPGASYTITWTNNEPKAYALYLDRASNVYFTQGVVSNVLASGTTSFVDSTVVGGQTYFYRVRTVNASGSTNQPLTPSQSGGVGTSLIGAYDFWGGGAS